MEVDAKVKVDHVCFLIWCAVGVNSSVIQVQLLQGSH